MKTEMEVQMLRAVTPNRDGYWFGVEDALQWALGRSVRGPLNRFIADIVEKEVSATARTEFEYCPAPHAGSRLMVQCTRYDKRGEIAARCWVEEHRLQPHSPTGIDRVIAMLRERSTS